MGLKVLVKVLVVGEGWEVEAGEGKWSRHHANQEALA